MIKNYITELKEKHFVKEIDRFYDFFQGIEKFSSSQLNQDDLEAFQAYINKRLERIPLDLLTIEDVTRPTPSISLDNEVKDMSEDESGKSEHQSQNSNHSENESKNRKENPENIIDQVIQEIEMQEKKGSNGT